MTSATGACLPTMPIPSSPDASGCGRMLHAHISAVRQDVLEMSDDELERHIQLQAAYKLAMKGEANRWLAAEEEALWERFLRHGDEQTWNPHGAREQ